MVLVDPIQDPKTVTCVSFQLYFYENLFFPTKTANYIAIKN